MKIVTLASEAQAAELQAALFADYKAKALLARGAAALDIVLATGLPAVPQITTSYTSAPPAVKGAEALALRQLVIGPAAEALTWPAEFAAARSAMTALDVAARDGLAASGIP